jgi:MFS transporter, DHA1 family, multidrug resistance protein
MSFPSWLPLLLGLLTAVGPVSTDMYLPAFPQIEADIGGGIAGSAQITLATWFVGLAIGQITQGTLSDRFGRRAPLIFGTALYTLANAGCALAPDLFTLSACRLLAALGGSASMVIPRAVVRDLADGHAAARLMSRLMLVMGAAPILAPSLGGLVLEFGDWQWIFWITTVYGFVCCALVAGLLPDTLPEAKRARLGAVGILLRYAGVLRERTFLTHALIQSFAMFAIFAYLGGSPGVFIDRFHLSPSLYGALFGICAAGYIAGSQLNPRVTLRLGPSLVLRIAARTLFAAAVALTVVAMTGWGGWLAVIVPVFFTMTAQGFLMPNATVGALSRHAGHAGSASALMGTMGFILGATSGLLVGVAADGTARPMALLMLIGGLGCVIADLSRASPR